MNSKLTRALANYYAFILSELNENEMSNIIEDLLERVGDPDSLMVEFSQVCQTLEEGEE